MNQYRKFTLDDLKPVLELDLREADLDELIVMSGGADPVSALTRSCLVSKELYVIETEDDGIVGVFGLSVPADQSVSIAVPWMVASEGIYKVRKEFFEGSLEVVSKWRNEFNLMLNYVDSRNTPAIRWLKRIGFTIEEDFPLHFPWARGVPFYQFYMYGRDLCVNQLQ